MEDNDVTSDSGWDLVQLSLNLKKRDGDFFVEIVMNLGYCKLGLSGMK